MQELHTRSYTDWVQSPMGFRPGRYWAEGRWIRDEEKPLQFYGHQEAIWAHALHRDPATLKFRYKTVVYSDIGKSGKTMFEASVGQWMGFYVEPGSEVKFCANKRKQSDMRVYGDFRRSVRALGRHLGKQQFVRMTESETQLENDTLVMSIPVSAGGEAGGHNSLIGWDELWGCDTLESKKFYAELKPDPTLNHSLTLIVSYAPYEGAATPLNGIYDSIFTSEGLLRDGVRYASDDDETLAGLPCYVKGDTFVYWNHDPYLPWHTPEMIEGERERLTMAGLLIDFERIWRNRVTTPVDRFIDIKMWDQCDNENLLSLPQRMQEPDGFRGGPTKLQMVLGADAAENQDHAGLTGRAWNPTTQTLDLVFDKEWRPAYKAGRIVVDLDDMKQQIARLATNHVVLACYYDPTQMALMALELEKMGVNMVRVTQGKLMEAIGMNYHMRIMNRVVQNYPDALELRTAVRNASKKHSGTGYRIWKPDGSKKKIDLAVADAMACYGAEEMKMYFKRQRSGKTREVHPKKDYHKIMRRSVW